MPCWHWAARARKIAAMMHRLPSVPAAPALLAILVLLAACAEPAVLREPVGAPVMAPPQGSAPPISPHLETDSERTVTLDLGSAGRKPEGSMFSRSADDPAAGGGSANRTTTAKPDSGGGVAGPNADADDWGLLAATPGLLKDEAGKDGSLSLRRVPGGYALPDGRMITGSGDGLYVAPDGRWVRQRGNMFLGSDGSVTVKSGDLYVHPDGSWSRRSGNTILRSDGSQCVIAGNTSTCTR